MIQLLNTYIGGTVVTVSFVVAEAFVAAMAVVLKRNNLIEMKAIAL